MSALMALVRAPVSTTLAVVPRRARASHPSGSRLREDPQGLLPSPWRPRRPRKPSVPERVQLSCRHSRTPWRLNRNLACGHSGPRQPLRGSRPRRTRLPCRCRWSAVHASRFILKGMSWSFQGSEAAAQSGWWLEAKPPCGLAAPSRIHHPIGPCPPDLENATSSLATSFPSAMGLPIRGVQASGFILKGTSLSC